MFGDKALLLLGQRRAFMLQPREPRIRGRAYEVDSQMLVR
jgi:hypothetical protein